MAEPGGQHREPGLDIDARAVPLQQAPDGERVPEIMQPGRAAFWPRRDPDGLDQVGEDVVSGVDQQPAAGGDKECRSAERADAPVAQIGVVAEHAGGRCVQENLAGFAVLGVDDRQDPGLEVDVAAIQAHRLPGAQPGDCQQPDQRPVGGLAQRLAEDGAGCLHQRQDLGVGVQVRRGRVGEAAQRAGERHLDVRVGRSQMGREAAHHRQSAPPVDGLGAGGQDRPGHRSLRGDRGDASLLQVVKELRQQALVLGQLVAKSPPQRKVPGGVLAEHRCPGRGHDEPGHGRTSSPRARRSSLA